MGLKDSDFREGFFEPEEICGYFVNGMMKKYWSAHIEILHELNRICEEMGIVYYADYGTLLGAVRHKGFIPWDDDIDISMTRGDYEKFRAEAHNYLRNGLTIYNNCRTALGPMRLVNTIAPQIGTDFLERYHGCPYSAGIDIYVLDRIPENPVENEEFIALMNCTKYLAQRYDKIYMSQEEHDRRYKNDGHTEESLEEMLQKIETITGFDVDRNGDMASQLTFLLNAEQGMCWEDNSTELVYMNGWCRGARTPLPYDVYGKPVWLQFENIEIMCPNDYHRVLTERFGEDYMTPKQLRSSHSHKGKAYAKSQKILLETYEKCGLTPPAEYLE